MSDSSGPRIRPATADDAPRLFALIEAEAEHHQQRHLLRATVDSVLRDGFGPTPRFGALVVEAHQAPGAPLMGYLTYTFNYSIWLGCPFMNVDDVYVEAAARGLGLGERLMHEARRLCWAQGIERMRWEVELDNEGAQRFYRRLGATVTAKGVCSWALGPPP